MIDPLTITDEPTARAHADMIFQGEMKAIEERVGEWLATEVSMAMWWAWEALSWDQRKVKASEIIRRQRNSATKTGA